MNEAADLISALASVGALAASIAAAFIARRLFFIERDRDARRDSEDRRRQASGVSAWIAIDVAADKAKSVVISNTSDGPIFNVIVRTAKLQNVPPSTPLLKCLPRGDFVYCCASDYPDRQAGSGPWSYLMNRDEFSGSLRPYSAKGDAAVVGVTFTDALNQKWKRESHGILIALDDELSCSETDLEPPQS